MFRKVPLIVILGSTGTGKTKLSIELAQKFNGEIISADSMQLYKGLDIVTAKATQEEVQSVPHHLLDIAHPGVPFTVVNFRDNALIVINDLLSQSKVPVVVGGTNYYIESLLWKVLVNPPPFINENSKRTISIDDDYYKTESLTKKPKVDDDFVENIKTEEIIKMSTPELEKLNSTILHEHLKVIDSESANRLHPNNKRKILRALEVFIQSGKSLTSILEEQRNIPGGSSLGGPLRYPHVIIFWLTCDQDILNDRLDKRVDAMVSQGLLNEVREFHNKYVKPFEDTDYTKGILQTIGFKEFLPYLQKYDADHDKLIMDYMKIDADERDKSNEPSGFDMIKECLDELKLVTKRYSKKQNKWVKNRLLGNKERQVPPIYSLDTSFPTNWNEEVFTKAEDILQSYVNDKVSKFQPMENIDNPREGLKEEITNVCKICDRIFIGEYQWDIHLKSNKHKKTVARKKKENI